MNQSALVLTLAFFVDILLGDPVYRFHPVRIMGEWFGWLEKIFLKYFSTEILWGIIFWFCSVIPFCGAFLLLHFILVSFNYHLMDLLLQVFTVYSCFAFRDMIDHARPVYENLALGKISAARKSLSQIAGRDVDYLDKDQIIRGAIESISESFLDAFMSPVWWYIVGAIAGSFWNSGIWMGTLAIIVYRCANTLDSMVGYKNEKYEKFGKFSARMDDVLNFIPARLCIIFLLPGIAVSHAMPAHALRIFLRDRLKSKSPNAAHPMSAFAGALNIVLGGETMYGGYMVQKPVIGESGIKLQIFMIKKSMQIYFYSGIIFLVIGILVILFSVKFFL
ncbi:MAG: adenosylcobinamide-phosphate synthase CbiB [Spirochaetia bacterium]|nr:adenosylcobinamide-phosphate synthase CbiB [Spirochaetia bacterium]